MSAYIKYFENGAKSMSFCPQQIGDVIKNKPGIKFHSEPVHDKTYIKVKVREFDGKIKTNLLGNDVPKENIHYTCIACITIDSVMKIGEKTIRKFI